MMVEHDRLVFLSVDADDFFPLGDGGLGAGVLSRRPLQMFHVEHFAQLHAGHTGRRRTGVSPTHTMPREPTTEVAGCVRSSLRDLASYPCLPSAGALHPVTPKTGVPGAPGWAIIATPLRGWERVVRNSQSQECLSRRRFSSESNRLRKNRLRHAP